MIITIGNIKGGVGKSTLACNIASIIPTIKGKSVALIDGDKQGSSAEYATMREMNYTGQAKFVCSRAVGAEVRQQAKGLAEQFDYVIVDAGGQDNPALRAALTVSNIVLTPVPPKSFETWSLDVMADLVSEVRETVNPSLKAYSFVNMGFPTGSDNQAAQTIIAEDYPVFEMVPTIIRQRKTFSDNAGKGMAVTEAKPRDPKAVAELIELMKYVGLYH